MKKKNVRLALIAIGLLSVSVLAAASDSKFSVSTIEIRGNSRTDLGTVLNYLPVKNGEVFDIQRDTSRAIRALYETGLFSDISLHRRDNTLVVALSERPVIATISIEGNEKIEDEHLEEALKNQGIYRGRVFNRSVLETMQRELRRLYTSTGSYSMKMKTAIETLERNRVAINITISEGKIATIRHINIVGNQIYDESTLLDLLESSEESANFFSSADEYSRLKLEGDLEILRSYYLDRGFIEFSIDSTQVSISSDKKAIYITINIDEGDRYTVGKIDLSGDFNIPQNELEALLTLGTGDIFSRRELLGNRTAITDRLGQDAYAFANINVSTQIDEQNKLVDVSFFIDAGKRVYINRIIFSGHSGTNDYVFRREMRMVEGGRFSPRQLERSKVRLQRLPFIREVHADSRRVHDSDDLVDIYIRLQEGTSGSFVVGLGVSSSGAVFNTSISQNNFLGTGNQASFSIDSSSANRSLSATYGESFHTVDGISRTVNAFRREQDASAVSSTIDFLNDSYGFGGIYGIPLSELSTLRAGLNFENTKITRTAGSTDEIRQFLMENGDDFDVATLDLSYTYDSRNRTVFAETGLLQQVSINVAIPSSDLEFYKLGHRLEILLPFD